MVAVVNNEIWHEFFELYHELSVLWKVKSDEYKNKSQKNKAWSILLEKYKDIDPNATLQNLKIKINNIRSCYRRELKKVNDSFKSGAGEEDVYEPSLWYFHCLDFLRDQEEETESVSSVDIEQTGEVAQSGSQTPVSKRLRRESPSTTRDELLKAACTHLEGLSKKPAEVADDAETYAKSWACSFRKLNEDQKLYARKAIEEIFIMGQLGQLEFNTVSYPRMSGAPLHVAGTSAVPVMVHSVAPEPVTEIPVSQTTMDIDGSQQFPRFVVVNQSTQPSASQTDQQYGATLTTYSGIADLLKDTQFS